MKYNGVPYKTPRMTCKGCNKHYLGCHDHCEDFITAHDEWEQDREKAKAHLLKDAELERHMSDQVTKVIRRKK